MSSVYFEADLGLPPVDGSMYFAADLALCPVDG
jgi:hypothetical protein